MPGTAGIPERSLEEQTMKAKNAPRDPSSSRTSSVATALSRTGGFLRTQLWIWPRMAALVLGFVGLWLRVKMEGAMQQQIRDNLQTILHASGETPARAALRAIGQSGVPRPRRTPDALPRQKPRVTPGGRPEPG